jgi:hypothetical protein
MKVHSSSLGPILMSEMAVRNSACLAIALYVVDDDGSWNLTLSSTRSIIVMSLFPLFKSIYCLSFPAV